MIQCRGEVLLTQVAMFFSFSKGEGIQATVEAEKLASWCELGQTESKWARYIEGTALCLLCSVFLALFCSSRFKEVKYVDEELGISFQRRLSRFDLGWSKVQSSGEDWGTRERTRGTFFGLNYSLLFYNQLSLIQLPISITLPQPPKESVHSSL